MICMVTDLARSFINWHYWGMKMTLKESNMSNWLKVIYLSRDNLECRKLETREDIIRMMVKGHDTLCSGWLGLLQIIKFLRLKRETYFQLYCIWPKRWLNGQTDSDCRLTISCRFECVIQKNLLYGTLWVALDREYAYRQPTVANVWPSELFSYVQVSY